MKLVKLFGDLDSLKISVFHFRKPLQGEQTLYVNSHDYRGLDTSQIGKDRTFLYYFNRTTFTSDPLRRSKVLCYTNLLLNKYFSLSSID